MNRPAILRTVELTRELEAQDARLEMNFWGKHYACSTVGCLAGWMTLDPELRDMGLHNASDLNPKPPHYQDLAPFFGEGDECSEGFLGLSRFLGVSYEQAHEVFSPDNPNSWPAARERLERLLETSFTVPAEIHTDDVALKVAFDALPFFIKASDDQIRELIGDGYRGGYGAGPSDSENGFANAVAQELIGTNPEIERLFWYLDRVNERNRETTGFEVSVDQASAEAWLQVHRPHLLEEA